MKPIYMIYLIKEEDKKDFIHFAIRNGYYTGESRGDFCPSGKPLEGICINFFPEASLLKEAVLNNNLLWILTNTKDEFFSFDKIASRFKQ